MAALASASAPIGRLSMRRSTRIRASTGNAVIDIETPMNSAKARNRLLGASSVYSGSALAMPSIIGTARPVFETARVSPRRPRNWLKSTSSPIRNM